MAFITVRYGVGNGRVDRWMGDMMMGVHHLVGLVQKQKAIFCGKLFYSLSCKSLCSIFTAQKILEIDLFRFSISCFMTRCLIYKNLAIPDSEPPIRFGVTSTVIWGAFYLSSRTYPPLLDLFSCVISKKYRQFD